MRAPYRVIGAITKLARAAEARRTCYLRYAFFIKDAGIEAGHSRFQLLRIPALRG